MDILLLGGTAFLGRETARRLIAGGHSVTCLARGTQAPPVGTTFVQADRDLPSALSPVANKTWDAVVDLTTQPEHAVRAAAQLSARHWIFISSGSVYTDFSVPGQTETAQTHVPLAADRMEDMSQFGAAKIACENAYRALGQQVTIIRPGLIGGKGDWTGRSGYYAWRCAHPTGPDVLVPDDSQPTAILDVEDLAEWIAHCIAETVTGTFNAAGQPATLGELYQRCQDLTDCQASIRVVDDHTLLAEGIQPWMGPNSLPLWIPDSKMRYTATLNSDLARENGLRTRRIAETLAAALNYEEVRTVPRQAGLTDDEEKSLRQSLS